MGTSVTVREQIDELLKASLPDSIYHEAANELAGKLTDIYNTHVAIDNIAQFSNWETNFPMLISMAVILLFLGAIGAIVTLKLWKGQISLQGLVNGPSGLASLSRFQLLIFTFVIAGSYFLMTMYAIASGQNAFPEIPLSVLGLLGVSSGSYLISKNMTNQKKQSHATVVDDNVPNATANTTENDK